MTILHFALHLSLITATNAAPPPDAGASPGAAPDPEAAAADKEAADPDKVIAPEGTSTESGEETAPATAGGVAVSPQVAKKSPDSDTVAAPAGAAKTDAGVPSESASDEDETYEDESYEDGGGADLSKLVRIFGYGTVTGGYSNGNEYAGASSTFRFGDIGGALLFVARPTEKLTITFAPHFGLDAEAGEFEAALDQLFGSWTLDGGTQLRFGLIKQPFGLYNEVYDVSVLQPLARLPQSIYGATGLLAEGYAGAGVSGAAFMGDWMFAWDLYGGSFAPEVEDPEELRTPEDPADTGASDFVESQALVVGGRGTFVTPVEGLEFGASSYARLDPHEKVPEPVGGVHLAYVGTRGSFRSEYTVARAHAKTLRHSAYVELAPMLSKRVQLPLRFDVLRNVRRGGRVVTAPLQRHMEFAGGLNLHLSPNLILRASYHAVLGNRFAIPEELENQGPDFDMSTLKNLTHAVFVGTSLSF